MKKLLLFFLLIGFLALDNSGRVAAGANLELKATETKAGLPPRPFMPREARARKPRNGQPGTGTAVFAHAS
jgi:hypothetical protein